MSLFARRNKPQRPTISWPVDRPSLDSLDSALPYPTVYSPISSSPSTESPFSMRWPLKDDIFELDGTSLTPSKDDEAPPPKPCEDVAVFAGGFDDSHLRRTIPPRSLRKVPSRADTAIELDGFELSRPYAGEQRASHDVEPASHQNEQRSETPRTSEPASSTRTIIENAPAPPKRTSSLHFSKLHEADLQQCLSRSRSRLKDDEEVYQDVYKNISTIRHARSFTALRSVSPLRPLRRKQQTRSREQLSPLSPLHSHPPWEEDEDLLEDLPSTTPAHSKLSSHGPFDDFDDVSPLPRSLYSSRESTPLSWRSPLSSNQAASIVSSNCSRPSMESNYSTTLSLRPHSKGSCNDWECGFNFEDYFEQIQHEIDISDDRPGDELIETAGKIPIFDSDGKGRPFSSIYSGETAIGEQQMVIFVRHFFCGACQAYLKALSKAIPFEKYFTLPKATSITIIGLGSPELINTYRSRTGCPFPIYSDPTKRLYRALGMGWTLRMGRTPDYMRGIGMRKWVMAQVEEMEHVDPKLKYHGGHMLWVGGEFLFKAGEVVWCHRMKSYKGHAEMDVVKKILELED